MQNKEIYDLLKDFRKETNEKLENICKLVTEHEVKIENLENNNNKINGKFILLYTSIFGSGGILGIIFGILKFLKII